MPEATLNPRLESSSPASTGESTRRDRDAEKAPEPGLEERSCAVRTASYMDT